MLQGKVAVITGSTSGIGLGIAKALAAQGCDIVLNGLGKADEIEAIRLNLIKETGRKVEFHGADMTKGDEITDMIAFAKKEMGRVDILVNNAGIQFVAPIDEYPADKWEAIIRIDLIASFYSIKAAIPHMKEQGWGRIINISSIHGLVASPFKTAYVAAKHGIVGLTKTVALEVAQKNITVNAICPGYVLTPLVENQIADTAKARNITPEDVINNVMLGSQPTKQFVKIDQVADLAVFLCSSSASNITGASLSIDGGWTAQ